MPGIVAFLAALYEWEIGPVTFATFVPTCILLMIGAQYWRAKLIQLRTGAEFPPGIALLARVEWPVFALTIGAVLLALAAWIEPGFAASTADRWTATIGATLALLEHVNYYHRQLQHFDHLPDIKRLFSGRGFRRSQMASDIARYRAQMGVSA